MFTILNNRKIKKVICKSSRIEGSFHQRKTSKEKHKKNSFIKENTCAKNKKFTIKHNNYICFRERDSSKELKEYKMETGKMREDIRIMRNELCEGPKEQRNKDKENPTQQDRSNIRSRKPVLTNIQQKRKIETEEAGKEIITTPGTSRTGETGKETRSTPGTSRLKRSRSDLHSRAPLTHKDKEKEKDNTENKHYDNNIEKEKEENTNGNIDKRTTSIDKKKTVNHKEETKRKQNKNNKKKRKTICKCSTTKAKKTTIKEKKGNKETRQRGKEKYLLILLLKAGDIETNPGPPMIPEPMLLEEEKLSTTLNLPEKDLFDINDFNFEEFLIKPHGIITIKKRLHNHIYSCASCGGLNNCFKKFMICYIKKPIPLSNTMINIIVECIQCLRCAYCLNKTKYKPNKFLPDGFVCNDECENRYMNEFICSYSETERQIKFHPEHRTRALWIKHLGIRTMNNIGRVPKCGEHYTYRTCITDCMNIEGIKSWIEDPTNSTKERKKRAKKRAVPSLDANKIIELLLNIAGGATCAGENCAKDLWLYKGESEYDSKTGLQFCSQNCNKSRKKSKIDCHKEKVRIIQNCIIEKYHLSFKDLFQEPKAGGASLLEQLKNYIEKEDVSNKKERIPGKIIEGTSKITTWNMQGASNIDQAINYLNTEKPAILCLQEARIKEDNYQIFQNKNYKSFQDREKGDLVTFVRKDINVKLIKDDVIKDISYMIVSIQTEGENINIANVYARDGQLHHRQLRYLTEKYKNIIILGDLNAKHNEILEHTQITQHNSNGIQLKKFLEGKDTLNSTQANVQVHNINDISEWTHTTSDGKWAQIDYIISHLSITHKITETQYEYMLISDHQGMSVKAPELFPETHMLSKAKYVPDWRTYNEWKYKYITEIELDAVVATGNWHEQTLTRKIEIFTNVQKFAFQNSIQYKQVSSRGNTKPRWLIQLIQQKRRYQNGLNKLASDTRKKREEAINTILGLPQPRIKYHYRQETYEHWEKNQKNYRTEIHRLARKINRSIIKIKKENWEKELTKLGDTDIRKAPKEFYSTMKRLSGLGRNSNGIRKMEYKGISANTEEGIANLMAENAQDSFKPLEDEQFNYFYFQTIKDEWMEAQEALNNANGNVEFNATDATDDFTWNTESTNIKNKMHTETETENYYPNLTKHQKNTWNLESSNNYKKIKEPLPPAPRLNMHVNNQLNEKEAHKCTKGKEELLTIYKPFNINELNKVINKMKRKAPGNDELVIDQFKDLGYGGKDKLLEIANEIYQTGEFPELWKQAIVVPILKKDKPAKDPSSYRPISLLPVGAKIVESLVLGKINPYLNKRGLIPVIQTGFRKGQSTAINLKRMYTHAYTRSIRSTHPAPTVMTFFDAKKAFDSVWHIGFLHKAMRDGLPGIIIRFFRTWLQNRTMKIRVGTTLSKEIKMESGVPQGSVLAPEAWNYNTGDIPTTKSAHSDTAVYADDTSTATTHRDIDTLIETAQQEIWQLSDWTKEKRIKFEPSKTNILAICSKPNKRREIKENTLYLDREKKEPLKYTNHAKLLGITFSETGTFHKHISDKLRLCYGRIKKLYRFAKHVKGDTLYKVYLTSIEPIITYGTEVLYENFSCNTMKKLNALEYTAIRTCYGLDRQTPTIDCLEYIQNGGIAERIDKRRNNFIENNKDSVIIKHSETLKYSEGRRIRVKNTHRDRSLRKTGWKTKLHLHKEHKFFSNNTTADKENIEKENIEKENLSIIQRNPAFQEGHRAENPIRFPEQEIPHVRFRCRPGHERGEQFDPG